ncbi:MAG: class I SAM-dependent methyltransferase [Tenericutes bacterium]|nr:class I SAM-dependent methyltransferase [Mycoplasmatota bacterium]
MNEENLITYYNKFNEDKRLTHRHGIVEFNTTIKYVLDILKTLDNPKIIDVGAGTGKYSIYLNDLGYDVTAVELVKHNLMTLKSKNKDIKSYLGNATNLSKFSDNSFDMVLLFGPLYHLITTEEKLKALKEAKRIVKNGGYILISYYMNEYAIITHGFKDNNILSAIKNNEVDNSFHITPKKTDLYSMVRLEDINYLKDELNLTRVKILSQDGPSDYIRKVINKMDDETFNIYLKYHLSTCERRELLGASSHVLDILKKDM